jgi:hypothetical protein
MSEEEMARAEAIHEATQLKLAALYHQTHEASNGQAMCIYERNALVSRIQAVKASMEVLSQAQDRDGLNLPEGLLPLLKAQLLELEQEKRESAERLDAASREVSRLRIEEMQNSAVLTAVNLLLSSRLQD